jgi:hypothetical protein
MGLQPEYRGIVELKRIDTAKGDPDADKENAALTLPRRPSVGSTFDVYGGLYFRETPITKTGLVIIPVRGTQSACSNLPYAAYVGYDVRSFVLGTLITGGTVDADLIVDVYKIDNRGYCIYLGTQTFRLANNTMYRVSLIDPTTSVDELAVFVRLRVRSFSGQPRVSAYASVLYTRTYRYGFEVGEFAARASGQSGYWINNYVRRVVIGPYVAYDGYVAQTASSSLRLTLATEPVNGVCKDLRVRFTINGRSPSGTSTYRGQYSGARCHYNINLPFFSQWSFQAEYSFAKAFGGGLLWVLDIEYTDGSTPFVATASLDGEAFRYWRWAEQWKTIPGVIDGIWMNAFLSSAFELYAGPTEPPPGPAIYHGLVTVRTNTIGQAQRVLLTISGRFIYPGMNSVAYINRAEIDLYVSLPVHGIRVEGEAYLMPDNQINYNTEPRWLEIALRILDAVNFVRIITGFGGRVAGLLLFTIGQGLKSAGDAVKAEVLDEKQNIARITYQRGWGTNVASDTIIIPLIIPSLSGRDTPAELEITRICLDGNCVNPSLKAYVQPDTGYWSLVMVPVKNWMFRAQVGSIIAYEISMR